jgi:hypothetical protein
MAALESKEVRTPIEGLKEPAGVAVLDPKHPQRCITRQVADLRETRNDHDLHYI